MRERACAVVASNASSIPEAGGNAAAYVPPDDDAALAAAIARVASDSPYADALRSRGRAWSAEFTWAKTARLTLEVIEQALRSATPYRT